MSTRLRASRDHLGGAALVALAFLALHLPFLPASLEDLDSINFALGVRRFDVAHHQPHPPGYPVYIAVAKAAHMAVPSEAKALALVSLVAGSLSVFALVALFRRITPAAWPRFVPLTAAALVGTAPMYWFSAVRPLSDTPGLAAAVAVQALAATATTQAGFVAAGFLAGFAAGLRSQVLWLTVPLLALAVQRALRKPDLFGPALPVGVLAAFVAGVLAWAVPLLALSGGPAAYWRAVFDQGAEDLSGVQMLWTTRSARQLLVALNSAFVAPWAVPVVAALVAVLAIAGAVRLYRASRSAFVTLLVAFGPYFVFDLLFQESVTTRYALPLVVPTAYLAACGLLIAGRPAAIAIAVVLAAFDAHVGGMSIASYASEPAPAFRLLGDMRESVASARPDLPVLATHRREDLDLRRPIVWAGSATPRFSDRLSAPPKHEWLELVKYWNGGGRRTVWFVADPLRTDLALVDHRDAWVARYRWPLEYHALVGGVRPDIMDWYRLRDPAWYLGEGWALTPETAGVAEEDSRGPGRAAVQGWIRRHPQASTLMIGGRNLTTAGPDAHVRVAIDGRTVDEAAVAPGFFLRMLPLPAGALAGAGDYATMTVSADSPRVAIEQFDAQPANRVVFGFGDGWQEAEYNPALGLQWRWASERAVLRVHAGGHAVTLTLRGEPPSVYFSKPSRVVVRAGGRVVSEQSLSDRFSMQVRIPAELVSGDEGAVTIESDQMYVPAQRSRRTGDRRHLALRVFECDLRASQP